MTARTATIGLMAVLGLIGAGTATHAATALEKALDQGAERLDADEIAEQFVGKTGVWVSPSGDKTIAIHYGENNELHGDMVGGDWSGSGYYAVADSDAICVSWDGQDKGRLRCLDVLAVDGVVTKFNADGSLNGTYDGFEDGKTF